MPIDDDADDESFRSTPIVAGVVKDTYAWASFCQTAESSALGQIYNNIEEWFDNAKAPRTGSKKGKNGSRKKRDTAKVERKLAKGEPGVSASRKNSKKGGLANDECLGNMEFVL